MPVPPSVRYSIGSPFIEISYFLRRQLQPAWQVGDCDHRSHRVSYTRIAACYSLPKGCRALRQSFKCRLHRPPKLMAKGGPPKSDLMTLAHCLLKPLMLR